MRQPRRSAVEPAGGVIAIGTGVANVYAIPAEDGLTLVDTGSARALARIDHVLRRHGFALSDVRRVIITHAHVDHTGALAALQADLPVTTLAHALDAPFIRGGEHPPGPSLARLRWLDRWVARLGSGLPAAARVDLELHDGDPLDEVAPGARVVHLPGHTPGQIGVWLPERRLLIAGDVVMNVLPWRLTLPFAAFTTDMATAIASVRRAAALEPQRLAVGHGPPLRRDAAARLAALAARQS